MTDPFTLPARDTGIYYGEAHVEVSVGGMGVWVEVTGHEADGAAREMTPTEARALADALLAAADELERANGG